VPLAEFPLGCRKSQQPTNHSQADLERAHLVVHEYDISSSTSQGPAVEPQKRCGQGLASSLSCHSRYVAPYSPYHTGNLFHANQQGCQVREPVRSCTSTFPAQRVKSAELSPVASLVTCHTCQPSRPNPSLPQEQLRHPQHLPNAVQSPSLIGR
jgi:hypothetical protein